MTEEEQNEIRRQPAYAKGFNDHRLYVENGRRWGSKEIGEDGKRRSTNPYRNGSSEYDAWMYGAYSALNDSYRNNWPRNLPPLGPEEHSAQLSLFD